MNWMSCMVAFKMELMSLSIKIKKSLTVTMKVLIDDDDPNFGKKFNNTYRVNNQSLKACSNDKKAN